MNTLGKTIEGKRTLSCNSTNGDNVQECEEVEKS